MSLSSRASDIRKADKLLTTTQAIEGMSLINDLSNKDLKQTAQVMNATLEQAISGDFECDPSENLGKIFAQLSAIDTSASKALYKEVCDMVNMSTSYIQEISKGLETYSMDSTWLEDYNKKLRLFCAELKNFSKSADKSKNADDIRRHGKNIKLAFIPLDSEYKKLVDILKTRANLDIEPPSKAKRLVINTWSFVKWLWQYKYALWITGMLVYNVYEYVYLPGPVSGALALITRVASAICFTFASDIVTLNKLIHLVIDIFALFALNIVKLMPLGGLVDKFGGIVKGAATGITAVMMFFTTSFMSSLIRIICITITNLGALIESGSVTSGIVWGEIVNLGQRLKEKGAIAAEFIIELFKSAGNTLTSFIFSIIDIGSSIIKPVTTTVTDTVASITSRVYGIFSWGAEKVVPSDRAVTALVQTGSKMVSPDNPVQLYQAIQANQLTTLVSTQGEIVALNPESVDEIFDMIMSGSKDPGVHGKQIGDLIRTIPGTVNQIAERTFDMAADILKEEVKKTTDTIGDKIFHSLEDSMKSQGTYKVYQSIKNINISGKESIITILFILSMITLFCGFLGV